MARPTKTGLDYYPMDVGFLRDKKVRLLRSEFGASSVLFVLYVLGKVYEGDGYFLAWDKDELLLAADELRETPAYISEVLQGCLKRSIFDERVFQMFSVLTSAGIQRRYLRGCEKRDGINRHNSKTIPGVNYTKMWEGICVDYATWRRRFQIPKRLGICRWLFDYQGT